MIKEIGHIQGKKLKQRLEELTAAENMSDIPIAARCHSLSGKLKGYYAVDLKHPYRLIFKPDHKPLPLLREGGLDKARVIQIMITKIIDYH